MTYGSVTHGSAPYGSGESGDRVLYWAIQPSSITNWADNATGAAQIRNGQDGTGAPLGNGTGGVDGVYGELPYGAVGEAEPTAGMYGSQPYEGPGVIDMLTAASGLTPGESYEFGFVVYDAATNTYSNVVVSAEFKAGGGAAAAAGGGKSRKPRKRRYQVEIDGEVHEVESLQEAEAVMAEVAQKATETAKLAIERAAKAKRRPVRKIVRDAEKALTVPEVSVPASLQSYADQMIGKIRAEYQSAMSAIEIAAHMAKREREIEEDDEDVLMLL